MVSDIVKNIVLKLKTEGGPEVQRQIQQLTKAGGINPRDTDKTLKNMSQVEDKLAKAGIKMSGEFAKVKKIFEELNSRHVEQFGRKVERITKLMSNQSSQLERMKAAGAPEAAIKAQIDRLMKANRLFHQMAANAPEVRQEEVPILPRGYTPPTPPGGGGTGGGLLGGFERFLKIGALASGAMTVLRAPSEYIETQGQIRSAYAGRLKDIHQDYYEGNLTKAALANEGYYKKVEAETKKRMTATDLWRGYGSTIVGAGAIGLGAALGSTGIGLAVGAPLMGVGLQYALGGRQLKEAETRATVEQQTLNETMTPEQIAYFRAHQRNRMNIQSRFNVTSQDLGNLRKAGYGSAFDEEEMNQAAEALRSFGGENAIKTLAPAAARAARAQGMSLQESTQHTAAMAFSATGGVGAASDNLAKVFAVGVASGIRDSGLLKSFDDMTDSLMSQAGFRTDAAKMAELVTTAAGPNAGARELAAVPEALQGIQTATAGTGLKQQLLLNAGLQAASKTGIKDRKLQLALGKELSEIPMDQLMAGQIPPHLRQALGPNADNIVKEMKDAHMTALRTGPVGRASLDVLQNPNATPQERAAAMSGLKAISGVKTEEAITGETNLLLNKSPLKGKTQAEIEDEADAQHSKNLEALRSPEGKAMGEEFRGKEALDRDTQAKITKSIDDIIKSYNETIVKAVREGGGEQLNSATADIVKAANGISAALAGAADSINKAMGNSSFHSFTPNNNKKQ